jgi:2-phosphosulfolactate phosphatase
VKSLDFLHDLLMVTLVLVDIVLGRQKPATNTVVIVDVLRSSTTIAVALGKGAKTVIPCRSIREARQVANRLGSEALLVGERYGIKPRGFDLNISPKELLTANIRGKKLVYTSTNLTRVLEPLKRKRSVLVGGFVNARRAANAAAALSTDGITIVACGLDHTITVEDIIGAGAIASYLNDQELTDSALIALSAYRNPSWRSVIYKGGVSRHLKRLGFADDIRSCLALDSVSTVPILRRGRFVSLR